MGEASVSTGDDVEFERRLGEELQGVLRVFVLGVGNELRGDDAAGPTLIRSMKHLRSRRVRVVNSGVTPENSAEALLRFKPSHVVLVDAVEASQPAGSVSIIGEEAISSVAISTHTLPLTLFTSYLRGQGLKAHFTFIGVQVKDVALGATMTAEVEAGVKRVAAALDRFLSQLKTGDHVEATPRR